MRENILQISIYAFLIGICLCACNERDQVRNMMSAFMKSEIYIPADLECVCGRQISQINIDSLKSKKYIVYYDSLDCSTCRINHLSEITSLFEMGSVYDFSVLTIFSSRAEDVEEIKVQLMASNYSMPIYVDVNESFKNKNKSIPSDPRFHNFLISAENKPIFIGNPLLSTELSELFRQVLNRYSEN